MCKRVAASVLRRASVSNERTLPETSLQGADAGSPAIRPSSFVLRPQKAHLQTEIVFSGFGGQGALFAGQLLAYAAMDEGRHVTWIPSYGPEMRGGTAHCTVIVSDEPIGSPLVRRPQAAVVMNLPSFDKYEPLVAPGGVLVVNTSLVAKTSLRSDLRLVPAPANSLADELGSPKLANMVLTGALVAATGVLPLEAVMRALAAHLPQRHHALLEANREALRRGAALAEAEPVFEFDPMV